MVHDYSSTPLDDLDIALMRELDADARQSHIELADKLPASRNTVRRRLKRLLDEKTLRFVTVTSPPALGYRTHATMAITVHPGDTDAVAEKLASFANVPFLLTTTGRYDIIAAAIFPNMEDLLDFMDNGLGSVSSLLSTEVMIGVNWMKFSLNPLTATNHAFPVTPRPHTLDELDLAIIRELETDPSQTNLHLARKLGINRLTLRKRIQTLVNDDIIRTGTLVNPLTVGYRVQAILLIKARPGKIKAAATKLTAVKEISNLIVTAGAYDMIAYAFFRDPNHVSEFIRGQASRIDGIIRIEAILVLDVRKMSLQMLRLGLQPVGASTRGSAT
ncbi:MAG: Lrp/AsnC family transcriptional regulator [Chloroflexi bacterium]|nr:Lrp/AsnC family transcriptional regulator [Chloroflexota bacterium]